LEKLRLPLHISGLWKPIYRDNYLETGSLGIGLVLEPLTEILLKENGECPLKINEACYNVDHVRIAREIYGLQDSIEMYQEIPLGAGAGLSANISIAIGYSISRKLLQDPANRIIFAGLLGHELEVSLRTGLGDVISELMGYGIEIRRRPGPPCIGDLVNVDVDKDILITVLILPRRVYTPTMLATYGGDLAKLFDKLYHYFLDEASIERFFEVSYKFSKEIGFLGKELEEQIRSVLKEGITSGAVLGFFVKKSLVVIGHTSELSFDKSGIRAVLPIEKIVSLKVVKKPLIDKINESVCSDTLRKYFDLKKARVIQ